MSEVLVREHEERAAVRLVMHAGANALDLPLLEALRTVVAKHRERGAPPLLLASAHPTLFSPGWDLKRLATANRNEVEMVLGRFSAAVLELFSYPGPTVAAVAGHAIAGGCLLALACDVRVMAAGPPRIGLSEVNLGVPVPADCVRMLRARLAPDVVSELVFRCDGLTAQRGREMGLVQRVATPDRMAMAIEQELAAAAARPHHAYVEAKRFLLGEAWAEMARDAKDQRSAFVDSWFHEETLKRVRTLADRLRA